MNIWITNTRLAHLIDGMDVHTQRLGLNPPECQLFMFIFILEDQIWFITGICTHTSFTSKKTSQFCPDMKIFRHVLAIDSSISKERNFLETKGI
jgi:hypothetical protein